MITMKPLTTLLKDEREAAREYRKFARLSKKPSTKRMFTKMAEDEARHARNIEKLIMGRVR